MGKVLQKHHTADKCRIVFCSVCFLRTRHRPFTKAIISTGGVDLSKFNPRTMESRLLPALYLAGKLLDLKRGAGGCDPHEAFSTGLLYDLSAAKALSWHLL